MNAPLGSRARNDVLRLEIAMHDALRVRGAEAGEDALQDDARLRERHAPARARVRAQRNAVEHLHHDVRRAVLGGADVEHAHDVGMDEALAHAPFFDEATLDVLVGEEIDREHLDGDRGFGCDSFGDATAPRRPSPSRPCRSGA